jgi:hypothetical protein
MEQNNAKICSAFAKLLQNGGICNKNFKKIQL